MTTILVTGARAPVALHWARILTAAGHRVILADSQRFPLSRPTRMKAGYIRLPSPRSGLAAYARAVDGAVLHEGIDLVLPTCEEVFFLAAVRDLHGAAIPLIAPHIDLLARVHDKFSFSKMAQGLGADPPATSFIGISHDLSCFQEQCGELVFKPVWSRFADRVLIRPQWRELRNIAPTPSDPWVAQAYLPGEELCCWAFAREGKIVALQSYRGLYRAGQGASLAFEAIGSAAIAQFVSNFASATAWTGQISFDFRHDAEGGLHAIECNPRATSGIHYFAAGDGLADALISGIPASASLEGAMTLPLAMLAYGLPAAMRARLVKQWYSDLGGMADISRWPGDRNMLPSQLLALAEIAVIALAKRISLKAAATADTEWNGESLAAG